MKDKLRELAERWKRYDSLRMCANELLAILDTEGDGGAVDFPRYRAIGFDAETNCAEMVADPGGAWVHVMDIPQVHPARSGVVSDEDVRDAERVLFENRLLPTWSDTVRAALEHFAKGERHDT